MIIIENKIYAYDQEEQLFKYYNKIISENYKKENIFIYYLTLDGREPSLNSIQNLVIGKDIRCISYKEEILEWIKHCMKESIFDNAEVLFKCLMRTMPEWIGEHSAAGDAIWDAACKEAERIFDEYQEALLEP